ncbi:hypothetical protein CL632_01445 [bacterium]|jgi:hypothetical protein|nr:hypothetical protein [bacterium]|tara:strand:- start:484 stop:1302 length:819 start_codon:yes stop_codon:yes gene_type:complete
MKETRQILLIWRGILAIASVALLVWLFYENLVPTGTLVLEYKKESATSPISDLHPDKRIIELSEDGDNQRFFVDPVYFDAKVPREFETVTVDIAWQNQSQPILELGARKIRGSWGFVLKPLQNKIIDNLDWPCQTYDKVMFCQKENKYQNLSSLLSDPPQESILSYNYVLPENVSHDIMNVNTDISNYNYLVATYVSPESLGDDWFHKQVAYKWQDFALHINEISFLVSAPELHKGHGQIVLGDISIILKRNPLDWQGFWEYVFNQAKRLKK